MSSETLRRKEIDALLDTDNVPDSQSVFAFSYWNPGTIAQQRTEHVTRAFVSYALKRITGALDLALENWENRVFNLRQAVQDAAEGYKSANVEKMWDEYVISDDYLRAVNAFTEKVAGVESCIMFKLRGVYPDEQRAKKAVTAIAANEGNMFNVYMGTTGAWMPLCSDTDTGLLSVLPTTYADEFLDKMMSGYADAMEARKQVFNKHVTAQYEAAKIERERKIREAEEPVAVVGGEHAPANGMVPDDTVPNSFAGGVSMAMGGKSVTPAFSGDGSGSVVSSGADSASTTTPELV